MNSSLDTSCRVSAVSGMCCIFPDPENKKSRRGEAAGFLNVSRCGF